MARVLIVTMLLTYKPHTTVNVNRLCKHDTDGCCYVLYVECHHFCYLLIWFFNIKWILWKM